ncbi:MAG: helix-turn-helix domain-containing protein [Longicatena caecimuris]|uniref:helix-turn-helix domain-containing protein n=1 Tax=Longicatena caecimuris TaxID=1796635 RepID=UPI00399B3FB6
MLNENIKAIRKAKGLSQEELAIKLNVVRQTISKWENGLSVPDSDMLISISEIFETPVSALLGESIIEQEADDVKVIAEKLEVINLQLAKRKETRRKILHWAFITLCLLLVVTFVFFLTLNSAYLNWDYGNPETAVQGVGVHIFEWLFIRIAPMAVVIAIIGAILTRNRKLHGL